MRTIQQTSDIEWLVDTFYEKVFVHEQLSPFFAHLDYPKHRAKMVHFWAFVLLDVPGYTTQVFDLHEKMHIDPALFEVWVKVFCENVDAHFQGELAEQAKLRAKTMGWTFAEKLKNQ
jgi:hemoglobin